MTSTLVSLPWRQPPRRDPVGEPDDDVPLPPRASIAVEAKHHRLFSDLNVGQSRSFPLERRVLVYDSARLWGKKHGAKFSVRRDPRDNECARIWRIE